MGILLLILKIIGIFLAVLLLFVIALIMVPVRYNINIRGQDEIEGKAIFYWMFHFVDMRIWYIDNKISYKLRIFGISIFREKKEGKKKRKSARKHTAENFKEEKQEEEKEKRLLENKEAGIKEETETTNGISQFDSVKDKAAGIKEKYLIIKNLLLEETNKNALFHVMRELKYLLRHYSPKKASGNIEFALGDPAQTGKVLGVISVFPLWARYKVNIIPDFMAEAFYVRGTLCMKGHIRSLHLLISFIRLIKDQDIRHLIKQMRN